MAQIPQIQIKKQDNKYFLIVDNTFVFQIENFTFEVSKLNPDQLPENLVDINFEVILTQKLNDNERVLLIEVNDNGKFYIILYHANPSPEIGIDLHMAKILEIPDYEKVKRIIEQIPELSTTEKIIRKIFNIN